MHEQDWPYIEVCGITEEREIAVLGTLIEERGIGHRSKAPHRVVLGIKASSESLALGYERPLKSTFLTAWEIDDLMVTFDHYKIDSVLHYRTSELVTIGLQAVGVCAAFDPDLVQIDADWPDMTLFVAEPRLILRIKEGARDRITSNLAVFSFQQEGDENFPGGVILDQSDGRGIPLDTDGTLAALRDINQLMPDLNLAITGGLDAESLPRILPIIREFPRLSISAEGCLRRPNGEIDLEKALAYLAKAYELLDSVR